MTTLPQFLSAALGGDSRPRAFGERRGTSTWEYTSSAEMHERARAIAAALTASGVRPGERVALIASNSVAWIAVDFGILFAGAVVVPIFPTLAADQIDFILNDCDAQIGFVDDLAVADHLAAVCNARCRFIALTGEGSATLRAFEAMGRGVENATIATTDRSVHDVSADVGTPSDLAVLIYTSGTTGDPKGVALSHANLVSNATTAVTLMPRALQTPGAPVLSVLPFAHIYEHTTMNAYVHARAELHVTAPDRLLVDMQDVRPVMMTLVPRIFERVLAGIRAKAKAQGGLATRLVPWALEIARRSATAIDERRALGVGLTLQRLVARALVLRKIAPALGLDRLEAFCSGSAPLHRDIALTFAGIGITIAEGYGLTETSPIVTSTPLDAVRYGSVGKPIAGVEVRIAEDGEILVRGPNVMLGYYRRADENPISSDGWFATGDIGRFDTDGYLFITDRKKELIKTSTGKYVAPGRVEAALRRSSLIGQCFVTGDGRPFPVALVAPAWEALRAELHIDPSVATAEIAARRDVLDLYEREAATHSADLATFEAIRRVGILPRDLTIEDGELSPTLKVKRRIVERKFAALIDAVYARAAVV